MAQLTITGELLDTLEKQHRQVEAIFKKLEKAEEASEQRPLVEQLTTALAEHMEIEETQVYPALSRLDAEMGEEAEIEHGLAREGLSTLQGMIGEPGFGAAVAMLQAGIADHVDEEESEAFPKLRKEDLELPARTSAKSGAKKATSKRPAKKAAAAKR